MSNTVIFFLKIFTAIVVIGVIVYLTHVIRDIAKKKPGTENKGSMAIHIIKCIFFSTILIGFCVFAINTLSSKNSQIITYVKDTCPMGCQISYGQALDNYLSDIEWEYFASDLQSDNLVVEVNGGCIYGDENVDMTLQFVFDSTVSADNITAESEFNLRYIGIDGETCTGDEANNFLNAAFSSYAESNNLPYEYCYFFE